MRTKIWHLTIPVIIANITIPLVGLVDTAVMGHLGSAHYIGAVALGSFIFSMVTVTFNFLRAATTGLVAQAFGAGDNASIILHFLRAAVVALAVGMVVILLAVPFIALMRLVISASPQVLDGMALYMGIVVFSAPALCFNMVVLGVLFGLQRVRLCMVQLVLVNCINVVGNLVLVFGFGMKIEGVALATVLAQYIGSGISLYLILRAVGMPALRYLPPFSDLVALPALYRYLGLGRDLIIRTFGLLLGEMLVLSSSASLGDVELAATQLCFIVFRVVAYGLDGFAHAAESLVGEAIGRRDPVMLRSTIHDSCFLAFVIAILMGVVIFALVRPFFHFLTNLADVLALAEGLIVWLCIMPAISVLAFQMDGVFIGATKATIMRNAMVISVLVFMPLVYFGKLWLGLHGVWFAFLILLALRGATLWRRIDKVYETALTP